MAKLIYEYEIDMEKTIIKFRNQDFTYTFFGGEDPKDCYSLEEELSIQIKKAFKNDENLEKILAIVNIIENGKVIDIGDILEELNKYENLKS